MTHRKVSPLVAFRTWGPCEGCGRPCKREAAHVIAKGQGGGKTLNLPLNLIALGGACDCGCHRRSHDGIATPNGTLLDIVARREGFPSGAALLEQIQRLIRAPTECKACPNCAGKGFFYAALARTLCDLCDGCGALRNGRPYHEQPRRLAGT